VADVDIVACTSCGARIWWAITVGDKRMPVDADPDADGTIVPVITRSPSGAPQRRVRVLTGVELPAQTRAWRAHWVTCPHADQHRKRRARLQPRCRVCDGPMDAELTRLEGWLDHPSCDQRPAPGWRDRASAAGQRGDALPAVEPHPALDLEDDHQ
jgi:hypothetical protein